MKLENYVKELEEYLDGWRWQRFCVEGDKRVYAKSFESFSGTFPISTGSHKKRFITLEEASDMIGRTLATAGYQEIPSMSIVNPAEDTLFTSAGVQIFNRPGAEFPTDKDFYIPQPVIRTQFFGSAKKIKGSSTSFVNICTERLGTTPENYIKHLDSWLNCLSLCGLYAGNMRLELSEKVDDWGRGQFGRVALRISYRDLEIGDISILSNAPSIHGTEDICDAGFGLERIAFSLNDNHTYYGCLWPANSFMNLDSHQLDIIRTATLLAGSGIKPGNNGQEYRLRRFLKEYQCYGTVDTTQLVSDFYNFWAKFTTLQSAIVETQSTISQELNRARNLRILKDNGMQKIDADLSKDVNEFSIDLLKRKVQTPKRVIKLEV